MPLVLESSDDDSRSDALFIGELANVRSSYMRHFIDESPPVFSWDQEVRSPFVRLGFEVGVAYVAFVNEYVLLAVQQNVRGLVEQD